MLSALQKAGGACAVLLLAATAGAQVTPPSAQPGGMPGAQTESQSTSPSNLPTVQTAPPQTGLATDPATTLQAAPQQAAQSRRKQALDARAAGTNPTGCPDPERSHLPPAVAPTARSPQATMSSSNARAAMEPARRTRCASTRTGLSSGREEPLWPGWAAAPRRVDAAVASRLIRDFRDHGFARLCAGYSRAVTDSAAAVTTLSLGHQANRVRDYAGGGPAWLADLDLRVDALANTHAWRHGEPARERFGETRLVEDTVMPKPGVTPMMKAAAADRVAEIRALLAKWAARRRRGCQRLDGADVRCRSGPARHHAGTCWRTAPARATDRCLARHCCLPPRLHPYDAAAKVRLLARSGAAINARAGDGSSALMVAAQHFWTPGLVEALLAVGADPRLKNTAGLTAIDALDAQEKLSASPAGVPGCACPAGPALAEGLGEFRFSRSPACGSIKGAAIPSSAGRCQIHKGLRG